MGHFSKQEIEEIRQRLAATAVKDSQFPTASVISLDDFVAIVQQGINKKVSIGDLFDDIGETIYNKFVISVPVYSKNGSMILRKPSSSADIEARVRIGDEDVTARINPIYFSWERSSGNATQDAIWNNAHKNYGNVVHITRSDVNEACTFYCIVPIEAIKSINI